MTEGCGDPTRSRGALISARRTDQAWALLSTVASFEPLQPPQWLLLPLEMKA